MDPKNLNATFTNYALTADPGKPLREANDEIARLKRQIAEMREDHARYLNETTAERNVYRSLVLKMLNLRD